VHELPVTRGVLDAALAAAAEAGAGRVVAIDVVVGELASFVDDSLQFYFDLLSRGTAAAGAVLRFRREPGRGQCDGCGRVFEARPPLERRCRECGSPDLRVRGGRDLYVDSIEVCDEGTGGDRDPEGQ
jgi:hydrogenase nickel incorporation protein HypA/HybF